MENRSDVDITGMEMEGLRSSRECVHQNNAAPGSDKRSGDGNFIMNRGLYLESGVAVS